MKKVLYLFLIIIINFSFTNCKKDTSPTEEEIQKKKEQIWAEIEKEKPDTVMDKDTTIKTEENILQSERPIQNEVKDSTSVTETVDNKTEVISSPNTNKTIYKVQIFSATNRSYANEVISDIEKKTGYKPYIKKRRNFYRVIIGDFNDKNKAQTIKDECVKIGYKDAYIIVQKPEQTQQTKNASTTTKDTDTNVLSGFFTIQIGSFKNKENANILAREAKGKTSLETFVIMDKNLYKVFCGKYKLHKDAEKHLGNVRNYYKDAFILKK